MVIGVIRGERSEIIGETIDGKSIESGRPGRYASPWDEYIGMEPGKVSERDSPPVRHGLERGSQKNKIPFISGGSHTAYILDS